VIQAMADNSLAEVVIQAMAGSNLAEVVIQAMAGNSLAEVATQAMAGSSLAEVGVISKAATAAAAAVAAATPTGLATRLAAWQARAAVSTQGPWASLASATSRAVVVAGSSTKVRSCPAFILWRALFVLRLCDMIEHAELTPHLL
jgi:hypothetical protein